MRSNRSPPTHGPQELVTRSVLYARARKQQGREKKRRVRAKCVSHKPSDDAVCDCSNRERRNRASSCKDVQKELAASRERQSCTKLGPEKEHMQRRGTRCRHYRQNCLCRTPHSTLCTFEHRTICFQWHASQSLSDVSVALPFINIIFCGGTEPEWRQAYPWCKEQCRVTPFLVRCSHHRHFIPHHPCTQRLSVRP